LFNPTNLETRIFGRSEHGHELELRNRNADRFNLPDLRVDQIKRGDVVTLPVTARQHQL